MELCSCPQCYSYDIWTIPEQDGFGRCHRCYVGLVWSFGWWRLLSESEWLLRHRLADARPWAWAEAHR